MNWWFKKHPELLASECEKLQSNGNYKECGRSRNSILISVGEIIVRLSDTKRYPVAIIYPESTPYTLPSVIPLKELLSQAEINELSTKKSHEAIKLLNDKDKVDFLNFWHQNQDGTICLLEADNLEKYGEFFSIREVINRVRDWLAGIETGRLPPDSPEVELYAHFRNKNEKFEFLIPSNFLYEPLSQGEFYCVQFSHVYPEFNRLEKYIYYGSVLAGENTKGIRVNPIEFETHTHLLPPGFNSALDLILKTDLLESYIKSRDWIEGYWWDSSIEVKPIQAISEFAEQVGNGCAEKGYQRMHKLIGGLIFSQKNDEYIIGVRFPNKRGEYQWQNFILKRGETSEHLIIGDRSLNAFKNQILNNYELQACRTSELSESKQHLRNKGRSDRNVLKNMAVNVIGCGALGSEFADTIGKAGIGKMSLVDYDRLNIENCVRHVLGSESISLFKADGLRQNILRHNPFIKVQCGINSVTNSPITDYFLEPGIGVSTIANDNTEGFLNEQALINNKVMFYGRALRGGKAARLFRVIPNKDACFFCLSLYKDEGDGVFTLIPEDDSLPTITNECNNPIRPSSAADIKLISSLLSQIVLNHLHNIEKNENHWIWSIEPINLQGREKIEPFSLTGAIIKPHPYCPYCQQPEKMNVEIGNKVLEFMRHETQKNPKVETGGVLLGVINGDVIAINHASEPGPKAEKESTRFLKDRVFCQQYIDRKYLEHGQSASYIGEWHFHPNGDNLPSNTDLSSLTNIANSEGYLTETPIMIILSYNGEPSCTIHPARKPYYFADLKIKTEQE